MVNHGHSRTLPLPATYVIDPDGTIRWAFVDTDYTARAEPSDILAALDELSRTHDSGARARVTVNLRQARASSAAPKETSKRSHQMLTLV